MKMSIYERQFDEKAENLLKAQRYIYRKAKSIELCYFLLCVIVPFLLKIIQIYYPDWKILLIIQIVLGLVAVSGLFFMYKIINIYIEKGAYIQNAYDKYVVGVGNEICNYDYETKVDKYVIRYKHKKKQDPYYENYNGMLEIKQIINCQKENLRYDSELRNSYIIFLWIISILIIFLICFIGLIKDVLFVRLLGQFLLCAPILVFIIRKNTAIKKNIINKEKLIELSKKIEEIAINGKYKDKTIISRCNDLQNSLYEYRKTAELIPEWFYKIFERTTRQSQEQTSEQIRKREQNENCDKK